MAARLPAHYGLAPATTKAPGEVLWQTPARRQPVWLMLLVAAVTMLVAAPAAFSGAGADTENPIRLLYMIADTTYELTGVLDETNATLAKIDRNAKPLKTLNTTMGVLATDTAAMADQTVELNGSLESTSASMGQSRAMLGTVNTRLSGLSGDMGGLRTSVDGALGATQAIVSDFDSIQASMESMDGTLRQVITAIGVSAPATRQFAENRTVKDIAGGDGRKYDAPNITAGSRVMSVALPLLVNMQKCGTITAKKVSATASNPLVGTLLNRQVPDGTNTIAHIQCYDGVYGLPGPEFFINNRVHGF